MLSRTQAESGRTTKQVQERISPNHVPTIFHFSVVFNLNVVYLCEIPIAIALTIVGSISALKQYHICRSEKKLGCVFATVFVKKGSARLTELSWLEF